MTWWWPARPAGAPGSRADRAVARRAESAAVPELDREGDSEWSSSGGRLVDAAGFVLDGGATREQCWERLPAAVQHRLVEVAGPTLAWSAVEVPAPPDGARRPQAAVFGRHGFAAADPTSKAHGSGDRPVYAVAAYRFDPDTLLHTDVVHSPGSALPVPGAHVARDADTLSTPLTDLAAVRGLDTGTAEVIASMPPRAQQLLVAPIAAHGEPVLRGHRFWQSASPRALEVTVVLASARRVTAVTGQRTIHAGGDATTAGWVLDAWHSEVRARTGI